MKLDDVIARVQCSCRPDVLSTSQELGVPAEAIAAIIQRTLLAVDLHVAADGEVYSPAPAPPPITIPTVPMMNRVRYGGRSRRRR